MPTAAQHDWKIAHNRNFVAFLKDSSSAFPDWTVTGIFYIAVHQVERYLYQKQRIHCTTHRKRERYFERIDDLQRIWNEYRELKTKSEDARYTAIRITSDDVAQAEKDLQTIKTHLEHCLS